MQALDRSEHRWQVDRLDGFTELPKHRTAPHRSQGRRPADAQQPHRITPQSKASPPSMSRDSRWRETNPHHQLGSLGIFATEHPVSLDSRGRLARGEWRFQPRDTIDHVALRLCSVRRGRTSFRRLKAGWSSPTGHFPIG